MFKEQPNRIFLENDNKEMYAEITYSLAGEDTYVINETYVMPEHQGKGIGKDLVYALVEKARQENKKIVPLCRFANAEFERNLTYNDVKK
jgi:uncharacterized protein